jgi:MFS family permease
MYTRNLALLSGLQGLLLTCNVALISVQALAGYLLVENKIYATLPATFYIVGTALMMLPASFVMERFGRKAGFLLAGAAGLVGAAIAALGMWQKSFVLLCIGTLILGVYNAFGQFYRFAAADQAPPDRKARAISLVLAGGLLGAFAGPTLAKATQSLSDVPFAASYAMLIALAACSMLVASLLRLPQEAAAQKSAQPARPMREIAQNPAFVVAVLSSALGYGVMNLLMVATPLAMGFCGFSFAASADVIMWHVVAMFAPSFFTGRIIEKLGVLTVMLTGAVLMLACVAMALSGQAVSHFTAALMLLGLGWNFMYVGGSTLLTQTYSPSEKAKVQGTHDLLVFCTTAVTSFASGALVKTQGWELLNQVSLVPIAVAVCAMLWLAAKRGLRATAAA